jgi:hypothetical protein
MFELLLHDRLPTLSTPWLENWKVQPVKVSGTGGVHLHTEFEQAVTNYFVGTALNNLTGLECLPVREIILGCNHAIDSLIMQHGLENLQIFEHDYKYYSRLGRHKSWAIPGQLLPGQPVLMALPSPGYLDLHPNQSAILDEALSKQCAVHLDCAWLGAARNISFDFSHPAVHSVSMSLSKSMDMFWNRIGVRYSRHQDDKNCVTIYNQHNMIHELAIETALVHLRQVPPDHVWNHYHTAYHEACSELKLRPTKMVHVMQSVDRTKMYGTKSLLERVWR